MACIEPVIQVEAASTHAASLTCFSYSLALSSAELSSLLARGGAGPRPEPKGSKPTGRPREDGGLELKPDPVVDVMGRTSVPPAVVRREAGPREMPPRPPRLEGVFGWPKGLLAGAPKPPMS